MREKFCADSKLEVNRIYSYGIQSGADTTLPVTLTGIFLTIRIMRLFARIFYLET